MKLRFDSNFLLYGSAIILFLVLCIIIFLYNLPINQRETYLSEGGPIELPSAIAWFICSLLLVLSYFKNIWHDGLSAGIICFAFGLRELDFQKKFTVMSIDKINFYIEPGTPIVQKVIVGFIVIFLFFLIYKVIRNNLFIFWRRLKQKQSASIVILIGILLLPLSKILDRFPNRLKEAGLSLPETVGQQASLWEEVLELAIPLLFLLIILQAAVYLKAHEANQ